MSSQPRRRPRRAVRPADFGPPAPQAVLLFEFVVQGTPRSAQTHNKQALLDWKNAVAAAAAARWPAEASLLRERLRLQVVFYHDGAEPGLDVDNMTKPIQDALNGVVYEDDSQVRETATRATSLDGAFYVRGLPLVLAEAFHHAQEFVHVAIQQEPDPRVLLR